ncbi:MAG: hypothetical protein ACPHBR_09555, partial [Flavobacteriales bacterium]
MKPSFLRFAAVACLAILAFWVAPPLTFAQGGPSTSVRADVNAFVQVTMNDGTLKFGTLLEVSESDVVLQIAGLGATRIPKYLVQTISSLEVDA